MILKNRMGITTLRMTLLLLPQNENDLSTSVEFTSPYVVKVTKEKETKGLEELDLDTGRRRSWVETTEHDVIDLTESSIAVAKRVNFGDNFS